MRMNNKLFESISGERALYQTIYKDFDKDGNDYGPRILTDVRRGVPMWIDFDAEEIGGDYGCEDTELNELANELKNYYKPSELEDIDFVRDDGEAVSVKDFLKYGSWQAAYNNYEDFDNYGENKVMNKKALFESILKESGRLNEFGGPKSWSAAGRSAAAAKATAQAAKSKELKTGGKINYRAVEGIGDIFENRYGIIVVVDFDKINLVYADPDGFYEIELPFKYDSDDFSEFEYYMRNKLKNSCAKVDFNSDENSQIDITMYVAPVSSIDSKAQQNVMDFWWSLIDEHLDKTYLGATPKPISDVTKSRLSNGHLVSYIKDKAFDKCFYEGK